MNSLLFGFDKNHKLTIVLVSSIVDYVTGCGDIRSKSERFLATHTPAANRPKLTRRFLEGQKNTKIVEQKCIFQVTSSF